MRRSGPICPLFRRLLFIGKRGANREPDVRAPLLDQRVPRFSRQTYPRIQHTLVPSFLPPCPVTLPVVSEGRSPLIRLNSPTLYTVPPIAYTVLPRCVIVERQRGGSLAPILSLDTPPPSVDVPTFNVLFQRVVFPRLSCILPLPAAFPLAASSRGGLLSPPHGFAPFEISTDGALLPSFFVPQGVPIIPPPASTTLSPRTSW